MNEFENETNNMKGVASFTEIRQLVRYIDLSPIAVDLSPLKEVQL